MKMQQIYIKRWQKIFKKKMYRRNEWKKLVVNISIKVLKTSLSLPLFLLEEFFVTVTDLVCFILVS